jgi:hypothetical protein
MGYVISFFFFEWAFKYSLFYYSDTLCPFFMPFGMDFFISIAHIFLLGI